MIIRIVRMSFQMEKVPEFIEFFNEKKQFIRNFPGCHHVDLLEDVRNPGYLSTYSHWESEDVLEAYRHSELFKEVWAQTKTYFRDKPSAHSYIIKA